jgi:hypothetical protein
MTNRRVRSDGRKIVKGGESGVGKKVWSARWEKKCGVQGGKNSVECKVGKIVEWEAGKKVELKVETGKIMCSEGEKNSRAESGNS